MNKKPSYIINLRNSLKDELRSMPLFQNGSAIIAVNDKSEVLLEERTDRNLWCIPGGLQELGETFEEVAVRELKEETGLKTNQENLILIGVISGESRKNSYPNGDQVYNNTVLYATYKYSGDLDCNYEELTDNIGSFTMRKETKQLEFFNIKNLPDNLMDKDLINAYISYADNKKKQNL